MLFIYILVQLSSVTDCCNSITGLVQPIRVTWQARCQAFSHADLPSFRKYRLLVSSSFQQSPLWKSD